MLSLVERKDEHAQKIRSIFETRCGVDDWPGDVLACIVSTTSLKDPKDCKSKLSQEQREDLEFDLRRADRAAHEAKLTSCEVYKERIDLLMKCEQMPMQSREPLKQHFEALTAEWDQKRVGKPEREVLCKQQVDALQAQGPLCGW